jgi:hypothetical protein
VPIARKKNDLSPTQEEKECEQLITEVRRLVDESLDVTSFGRALILNGSDSLKRPLCSATWHSNIGSSHWNLTWILHPGNICQFTFCRVSQAHTSANCTNEGESNHDPGTTTHSTRARIDELLAGSPFSGALNLDGSLFRTRAIPALAKTHSDPMCKLHSGTGKNEGERRQRYSQ